MTGDDFGSTEDRGEHGKMVPPTLLDVSGRQEFRLLVPFGSLAFAGAIGSLLCCYFVILLSVLSGLEPVSLSQVINPHVQAVVMWGLALLAVYALWRDRAHHSSNIPIALGATATVILIGTLYIGYDNRIELIAYVLLVVSALLNQNAFLGTLNRKVASQAHQIDALNRDLATKVERQGAEINRLGQLRRFLPPDVAELVVGEDGERLLESHRRYIACLFCDLREFTRLSESVEPEEVIALLKDYHAEVDRLVMEHNGTIGFRSGDGVMAFFNDPVPCDRPVLEAVAAAISIRASFDELRKPWLRRDLAVGIGFGVESGYATLGLVGLGGRVDYTAIGGVVNIASRLCDLAEHGQILIGQRAIIDVEDDVVAEEVGTFELKGVSQATTVRNVADLSHQTSVTVTDDSGP